MIYRVITTDAAKNDMREIHKYIVGESLNPDAAFNCIFLIEKAIRSLDEMPARFPRARDNVLAAEGYRCVLVKSYLVFYVIFEEIKTVSVIRIIHERRDRPRILRK